jgi:ABC-type amino acid transport substrate-binding protein
MRSVLDTKRLRVGMSAGFAPFVVAGAGCDELIGLIGEDPPQRHTAENGTTVAGLDVDLAKAVAEALGVRLEVHLTPTFREIFAPLGSGQVDAAISGITRTLERARSLSFSQPYLVSGQKLLVKDESRFASIEAVNRKDVRVGFKSGTTGESFVRGNLAAASLVAFANSDELFRALEANNLEAAIADSLVGRDMVVRKKVKSALHPVGGRRLTSESICMAARQSDGDWTDFLSLVIRELKTSGQFHRLVRRYNPWLRIQRG